jgi:integrase
VLLSFVTGMRRSSLVATPAIATRVTPAVVFLNVPLKGGGFYDVPIHPAAWELTAAYRTALGDLSGLSPLFRSFSQPTVSTGARAPGAQLSTDGLYKILGKRAVEAGIADFHPHRCRHSFSTWCHMANIPTDRIEVVTGHKGNQSIARRVYGDDAMLAPQVVNAVWQAIGGVLGLV